MMPDPLRGTALSRGADLVVRPLAPAAWPRRGVFACLGLMAVAALVLTGVSLRWPLVGDTAVMHYIAARILDGAVPYRDLFDMNFPGVYLAHMAGIGSFGYGEGVVRMLDLIVLGLILSAMALSLAPFGIVASAGAGLMFWLYHVTAGAPEVLQRDYLWCLPLAGTAASVAAHARTGRMGWLALGGAMIGLGAGVKPLSLMLLPVLMALTWRAGGRRRWIHLAVVVVMAVAAPLAITTWLWRLGGLSAFVGIVREYLPLYAEFDRSPALWILARPAVIVLVPWAALGALVLWRAGRVNGTTVFLAFGVAFGITNLVLQGKGFGYHAYPLVLFATMLGSVGLAAALDHGRGTVVMASFFVLVNLGLARRGVEYFDGASADRDSARVDAVVDLVRPVLTQGRSVQVLDDQIGGLHALYRLRAAQATRFLYDFHFYHHVDQPFIRRLRRELMDQLRAARPGGVVVFQNGQPVGDLDRIRRFPELARWLDDGYRLGCQGDVFRVYVARDLKSGGPAISCAG